HLPVVELVQEVAVGLPRRVVRTADQLLREEREYDHDQDRERGALEKPAHAEKTGLDSESGTVKRSIWSETAKHLHEPLFIARSLPSTPRRTASCDSARRSPARTRPRTGWESRTPHT